MKFIVAKCFQMFPFGKFSELGAVEVLLLSRTDRVPNVGYCFF